MTTEPIDPDRLRALRDYYDTTDTSEELAVGIDDGTVVWDTTTGPGPAGPLG